MKKLQLTIIAGLCASFGAQAGIVGGPNDLMGHDMPMIVKKLIPARATDTTREGLRVKTLPANTPASSLPFKNNIGAFRVTCKFSHTNFDDPIKFPGVEDATHLHTYAGNIAADYRTTDDNVRTGIGSTCPGGTANETAYWFPTPTDTATGAPLRLNAALIYYKTGYNGIMPHQVQVMPDKLHMIAGKATNAEPKGHFEFKCNGISQPQALRQWMPTCKAGDKLWIGVTFPQCWDGTRLDTPDQSHMSYTVPRIIGVDQVDQRYGKWCPATHPVPLPEVEIIQIYDIADDGMTQRLRLSSDMYPPAAAGQPSNAGWSAHADWFDGHDPVIKATWTKFCLQASMDCRNDLLGDGTTLY
jgi:hypothetical protein